MPSPVLPNSSRFSFPVKKREGGELFELGFDDAAIVRPVPVFDRRLVAKAGARCQGLGDSVLPKQGFVLEQQPQKIERVHLIREGFRSAALHVAVNAEQSKLMREQARLIRNHDSPPWVSAPSA